MEKVIVRWAREDLVQILVGYSPALFHIVSHNNEQIIFEITDYDPIRIEMFSAKLTSFLIKNNPCSILALKSSRDQPHVIYIEAYQTFTQEEAEEIVLDYKSVPKGILDREIE